MRFIINLPQEELESVERICFQVEEAQWFYEDFIRPLDPDLPSLNLRNFCLLIFQHCPMLSTYSSYDHAQAFSEFLAYKTRVPVRGAILLNEKMDEVILVKGWKKGANWSFPRGKINKDEPDLACAVREVYEETGYDIDGAGLVAVGSETKYIEMNLREQHMRLYVFRGVPMDTHFEPRTRKEISKIQWWKLSDLPTLKKKKQSQEGQGGDAAINANKFYMVAPFLPSLKKWISSQRKLDRMRKASMSASAPIVTDEEAVTNGEHELEEEKILSMSNGDMTKLLEGLRKSAQPTKASGLPEVTLPTDAPEDIAGQLKSFLGVATNPPEKHTAQERQMAPEAVGNPKASNLLALLQSKPTQSMQQPQTPMEQIIENPPLPSSPTRHHNQPLHSSRMPELPRFPIQSQAVLTDSHLPRKPEIPQTRPISPPQHPAQLVPRNSQVRSNYTAPKIHNNGRAIAPYQRTGDPQFAQYTQKPDYRPSVIPRASNLPPPKLNAQSSALLSLFKSNPPSKAPDTTNHAQYLGKSTSQGPKVTPLTDQHGTQTSGAPRDEAGSVQVPVKSDSRTGPQSMDIHVPPQITPRTRTKKAKHTDQSKTEQHEKLLSLFRNPAMAVTEPTKPATPTLQLPSVPIELSALPTTPGHSREPSRNNHAISDQAQQLPQTSPVNQPRLSRGSFTHQQNPPVSATINGPLNIPQFDMIAKASKDAKRAPNDMSRSETTKPSPIKILARPTSSQENAPIKTEHALNKASPAAKHAKAGPPNIRTLATPVKKPPPTPDLKGYEAPPKAFHPQILRRPAHLADSNEPSPIQPLPSPKHNLLADRNPAQPADHRTSLLSLFSKPSPAISPPSAAPVSTIDPSALISPLTGQTPKQQAEEAFARLSESVGKLSHEPTTDRVPSTSSALPMIKTGSINTTVTEGSKTGRNSGKQTPTSKTTPIDKTFLLGYLNRVAEGGK